MGCLGEGGGKLEGVVSLLVSRLSTLSATGASLGDGGALLLAVKVLAVTGAGLATGLASLGGCESGAAGTCAAASLPLLACLGEEGALEGSETGATATTVSRQALRH